MEGLLDRIHAASRYAYCSDCQVQQVLTLAALWLCFQIPCVLCRNSPFVQYAVIGRHRQRSTARYSLLAKAQSSPISSFSEPLLQCFEILPEIQLSPTHDFALVLLESSAPPAQQRVQSGASQGFRPRGGQGEHSDQIISLASQQVCRSHQRHSR